MYLTALYEVGSFVTCECRLLLLNHVEAAIAHTPREAFADLLVRDLGAAVREKYEPRRRIILWVGRRSPIAGGLNIRKGMTVP